MLYLVQPRRVRLGVPIVLAGAFSLRLAWFMISRDLPIAGDEYNYWIAAQMYAAGQAPVPPYWPPGTPLFGAGVIVLLGDNISTLRLAMCAVGVLNVWLVYWIARLVLSASAARWAVGLAAFFPPWVFVGSSFLSQTLSATYTLVATWAALQIIVRRQIRFAIPLGIAVGLGTLVRPSLLPMAVIGVLVCVLAHRNRRGVAAAALVAVTTAMPILPFTLINHRVTGEYLMLSTNNGWNLYAGNNPDTHWYATWLLASDPDLRASSAAVAAGRSQTAALNPVQRHRVWSALAQNHIVQEPMDFAVRVLSRFRTYWAFDSSTPADLRAFAPWNWGRVVVAAMLAVNAAIYVAIVVAAALSIGTFRDKPVRLQALVLVAMIVANMAAYLVAFAHPTYHFCCMGLLFILAAGPMRTLFTGRLLGFRALLARWTATKLVLVVLILAIQVEWVLFMARRF